MKSMRLCALALCAIAVGAAQAQSLSTTFVGGNRFAGNMFDVTCTNAGGLTITGFDVHLATSTVQATIEIWWRNGTYVGAESSSAGWTSLGTALVTSAGVNTPTAVNLAGPAMTNGQTMGFFAFVNDFTANPAPNGAPTMEYTNLNGSNHLYTNADMTIQGGIGRGASVGGDQFASSIFGVPGSTTNGRMWNGTVYYSTVPEPTTMALLGIGAAAVIARRRKKS